MSTPTNHWKLGLFVVVGLAGVVGTIAFFGARALKKEAVAYTSYFDESVQGLELGSPVKFRGVSIGNVSSIDVAGDKRHVEVTFELGVKVLHSLGLAVDETSGKRTKLVIPSDLRVQLASAGITGVKFILIDFFDEKMHPPLSLPFEAPENYIPTAPSMMKGLEDSVTSAVDRFPELAQQMLAVLTRISNVLGEIEAIGLPDKIKETLLLIDLVLKQLNSSLVALDTGSLSKDAQATLKGINAALTGINDVVGRVGGEKGLAVSLHRTSEALGSMASNANHVGPAAEDALKDVQGAALSIQRLADALELDPDMLLKGRGKRVSR